MKTATLGTVILLGLIAGGCTKTVGPEEFLLTLRRGVAETGAKVGYRSEYTGSDDEYHYITTRYYHLEGPVQDVLLWGPFHDEKIRCLYESLPTDFPAGFENATVQRSRLGVRTGGMEPKAASQAYVRQYLAARGLVRQTGNPPPRQ